MPRNRNRRTLARRTDMPAQPVPDHANYEIKVNPVPVQPHEHEQWYWHLFYKGEKVNGGISDYETEARERAVGYRFDHHRDLWLKRNFWDQDSQRWRAREVL